MRALRGAAGRPARDRPGPAPRRHPLPPARPAGQRLEGRTVLRFARRAKYIECFLDDGEVLLLHLGMSGRLRVRRRAVRPARAPHLRLRRRHPPALRRPAPVRHARPVPGGPPEPAPLARASRPRAAGPRVRRAQPRGGPGRAAHGAEGGADGPAAGGGRRQHLRQREPVSRPPRPLAARRQPRRARGGAAGAVGPAVLREAIEAGGSSLRDYVQSNGELGNFQRSFRVYDRAGEPCLGCGGPVERIVQGARATFWCARASADGRRLGPGRRACVRV